MKEKILSRRELIRFGGMATMAGIILPSCVQTSATQNSNGTSTAAASGSCGVIPSETEGPYPAHDDRGINVLTLAGIERSDIRSSLNAGSYTGTATATGLPLTIKLQLVDVSNGCTPLSNYAIYIWHCNSSGKYSMYSSGITQETYLSGVQITDSEGRVSFTTIFPGCYDGRMPHMHFEIFNSIAQAVDNDYVVKTSQLSFPTSVCSSVYNNNSLYSASISNFSRISFSTDNVFSDGTTYQIATIESGNFATGYVASLVVGI